ncbi:GerAB/ArcD/ProY family transporter [Cohnella zeiphila]|uniref:Endospore germination permease n=1 Tax=Cohnella zeiphila TaxID=2761120 RepID=A0A7X0SPU3_9BACL|nr:endospore germination permease [Cohnella zeiphila]MBB6733796.1 endospore germination permease [Cohnella zeiphila]
MRDSSSLTANQLGSLLIAASMGSAIVYIPAPLAQAAGNGSWLSVLAAYLFGLAMLGGILYLYRRHGKEGGLFGCCRQLLGRVAGPAVLVPVVGMLFFAIPAIVAGIGDFFVSGMMPRTPPYIFCSFSLAVSALTAKAGSKITARLFVMLVPVMVVFSLAVLILALPLYDWGRLLPIADKGIKPVLHGLLIAGGFPFGEVFLFLAFLPYASKEQEKLLPGRLIRAFTITGVLMFLAAICSTAAFGAAAGHFNYSLYTLASNIGGSGSSQRVEAVIGMALILGSYMKATVYLLILNRIMAQLLGAKDESAFIFPIALVCVMLSLTLFANPADFLFQVYTVWPCTVLGIGCGLTLLLVVLSWLRGNPGSQERKNAA